MAHITKYGRLTDIKPTEDNRTCTLAATSILPHNPDKAATHEARNANGNRVRLCSYCASYALAFQWAEGLKMQISGEQMLYALALVWRQERGFCMPQVSQELHLRRLGSLAFNLAALVDEKLLQKIGPRYLLRDACPACYLRGAHDLDCGLLFGEEFAQRSDEHVR